GHRFGTAHPAAVVIPAALAEVEKQNATLGKLLKAIVIGYDVMLRLSKAINPSHLKRGFHSTSTTGTIGSAAAVASIMKYDEPGMAHALSIAGLLSAGLQEMLHGNPSIKSFQVGRSCQSGVLAAQFVEYGGKGPASLFEGQHGWIKAMTDSFNENDLMDELGKRWEILNTYTKLYPTCRHCHHAIDLAIDAYNNGIRIHDISKIKIKTYSVGISEVGLIKNPDTIQDAMFSIAYAVLIAFKYGYVTYENMERHLDDEYLQRLSSKIEIESDEVMDKEYPQERGSILEIATMSGKTHILLNKLPRGEPETSLNRKEYLLKFTRITENYMAKKQVEELFEIIFKMDLNQPITSILSCFEKQNGYQT
ncbi:MmgE/PrpD family protein, partial [candidate division KSB1 bacterium]|nr:MmgE/PrpD family protein [candidate division KSB1 bacterium]